MKKRITIVFSILIVLVTAFSGVFSYVIFKNAYYESTESNLKSNSEYIVEDLMPGYIKTGDVTGLEHMPTAPTSASTSLMWRGMSCLSP